MKEHWKSDNKQQSVALEEGRLQVRKQERTKKLDSENKCCNRQCFQLTLFLGWLLFCGWCFYVAYENIHFEKMNGEISNIIRKTFRELIYESQPEMQDSHRNTGTSVILIKPEVVINKRNNILEERSLIEEQDTRQDETTVRNALNAFGFINDYDNAMQTSNIGGLSTTAVPQRLHGDRIDDKERVKTSTWNFNTNRYDDINPDDDDDDDDSFLYKQFLKKLRDSHVISVKINSDVKEPESSDIFISHNNRLNSHENGASNIDAPSSLESSTSDVTTISNFDNLQNREVIASPTNLELNLELRKFFHLLGDSEQNDRSDISSSSDATNANFKRFDLSSFHKFPESSEHLADDSSIPRFLLTQGNSEQVRNKPRHGIDVRNEDRRGIDDSDSPTPTSDTSIVGRRDSFLGLFDYDESMASAQSAESQHSSEIEHNTRKDEKSIENIKDSFEFWLSPPTIQDSVEYPWVKSDVEHAFIKPSSYVADNTQVKSEDASGSSETLSSSPDEDTEMIESGVPKNHCKFEIASGIARLKCPAIKFREEWDLSAAESSTEVPAEVPHESDTYENHYGYIGYGEDAFSKSKDELIPKEHSDVEKIAKSQHSDASVTVELKKSIKMTNDALLESSETAEIDSPAHARDSQDYEIYNTNSEQQQEFNGFVGFTDPLESHYVAIGTLEIDKPILEQKLTAIYDNEMHTFRRMYGEVVNKYASTGRIVNMCNILPYTCNRSAVSDMFISRKKRAVNNLTWQQETSNTLQENSETVALLKKLERVYQKLEVLATCIDRLHERSLFHNKLDDDYISREISKNIEE